MFSYLSTEVSTIYPRPHSAMAFAVFSGSLGSSGGGAFDVLTEQNLHPRVQVSPISMMVAVAVSEFPPPLKTKWSMRAFFFHVFLAIHVQYLRPYGNS